MSKLTYKNAHFEYERRARVAVDHAEEKLRDAVDAADDPKTDAGVRAARIQLIRAKTAQQKVEKHTDGVEKRRVAKKSNKYLLLFLVVAGFSAVLYFGLLEGEFTILGVMGIVVFFLIIYLWNSRNE